LLLTPKEGFLKFQDLWMLIPVSLTDARIGDIVHVLWCIAHTGILSLPSGSSSNPLGLFFLSGCIPGILFSSLMQHSFIRVTTTVIGVEIHVPLVLGTRTTLIHRGFGLEEKVPSEGRQQIRHGIYGSGGLTGAGGKGRCRRRRWEELGSGVEELLV
jgi:hypothetical protein